MCGYIFLTIQIDDEENRMPPRFGPVPTIHQMEPAFLMIFVELFAVVVHG